MPEVLKLSFFTRAIRLSISVVAVIALYAPFFRSTRGANAGLIGACVVTSVWYLLGDPFGINNMYIALLTPAVIMVIDRLIPGKAQGKAPTPLKTMESDMSVTVTRDGIIRPQQDTRVEAAMLPSAAHKTTRQICCRCRMVR